jgi:formylmethanofuran dehydrogenase subunit E
MEASDTGCKKVMDNLIEKVEDHLTKFKMRGVKNVMLGKSRDIFITTECECGEEIRDHDVEEDDKVPTCKYCKEDYNG